MFDPSPWILTFVIENSSIGEVLDISCVSPENPLTIARVRTRHSLRALGPFSGIFIKSISFAFDRGFVFCVCFPVKVCLYFIVIFAWIGRKVF